MIEYSEHTLGNGLRVIANRDRHSALAAVNILYMVGARNENPARTGFAHLFEHLMFRGTRSIPNYDVPVQEAGGENNAFTNNDYTDYYITLPKDNIETAFWLESDRMTGLDIDARSLDTEKAVVIAEFNQRYLNRPYGEQWMMLREMVYKKHPYRWATIGLTPDHIRRATLSEVRAFYERYYEPSNAILSVSADMEPEKAFALAEKWFGPLPRRPRPEDRIPEEPEQTEARRMEVSRKVPAVQLSAAFRMGGRTSRQFYRCDLTSDLLAGGTSGRLYRDLIRDRQLFSSINAYCSGDADPGMFVVTGQLMPGVTERQAEEAIWEELDSLKHEPVPDYESEKVKNKFEANTVFGELNIMNKAMNLGFYAMLGDLSLVNEETGIYRSITAGEIMENARQVFVPERSSTLIIRPE